jgi:Uma2 family endonuclease
MAVVTKRLLTEAEYLARERAASIRSEFLRGEMFAMSGARYPHNRVKENAARNVGNQLQGGPCFVLSSDQRVKVSSTGLYTYPDILIVCGPPEFEDSVLDTLLNPRVIFEGLSESTEAYGRGAKFAHYRQLTSLEEYVLISQDRPLVER